jgi:hypothetical protein
MMPAIHKIFLETVFCIALKPALKSEVQLGIRDVDCPRHWQALSCKGSYVIWIKTLKINNY